MYWEDNTGRKRPEERVRVKLKGLPETSIPDVGFFFRTVLDPRVVLCILYVVSELFGNGFSVLVLFLDSSIRFGVKATKCREYQLRVQCSIVTIRKVGQSWNDLLTTKTFTIHDRLPKSLIVSKTIAIHWYTFRENVIFLVIVFDQVKGIIIEKFLGWFSRHFSLQLYPLVHRDNTIPSLSANRELGTTVTVRETIKIISYLVLTSVPSVRNSYCTVQLANFSQGKGFS